MDTEDIEKYAKLKREIHVSIGEHEILLSFNNDVEAEAFDEWWHSEGKVRFIAWAREWEP